MSEAKNDNMNEEMVCPVGRFFSKLEKSSLRKSKFMEHLSRSRIEFLRAVKSLIDERIENLEKEAGPEGRKSAAKIEVE